MILPATSERSSVFSYKGTTFIVGMTTGKVTVMDGGTPVIPPNPVVPPAPSLQGLSKQVYDSIMAAPIDAQNRVLGAKALMGAIDSTVSEVGGLGIEVPQEIVGRFAANAEAAQVNQLLKGWRLGDLLSNANIVTKEQLLAAFEDIKRGLGAIK